jgi:hypothetical protein
LLKIFSLEAPFISARVLGVSRPVRKKKIKFFNVKKCHSVVVIKRMAIFLESFLDDDFGKKNLFDFFYG